VLGNIQYGSYNSDADVDQDSGNMVMCGGTYANHNELGVIQNNKGYAQGYIMLADINGRIYWYYSGTFTYGVANQIITSCRFS